MHGLEYADPHEALEGIRTSTIFSSQPKLSPQQKRGRVKRIYWTSNPDTDINKQQKQESREIWGDTERQPVPAHSWQPPCYFKSRSGIALWKEAGQLKFISHDGRKHRIWIEKWTYAFIHASWNGEMNQVRIVIGITWKWCLYKLSLRTIVSVSSLLAVIMCQGNPDRNYKLRNIVSRKIFIYRYADAAGMEYI